jgi:hypothetical protein
MATTETEQLDRRGRRKEAKLAVILAEAWALARLSRCGIWLIESTCASPRSTPTSTRSSVCTT